MSEDIFAFKDGGDVLPESADSPAVDLGVGKMLSDPTSLTG